jgi:prepilin-type N-terminal cleavage/methylation domain-containing protein
VQHRAPDGAGLGVLSMRGLAHRATERLARDEGFTLTELLVAMTIGLVVMGAGVMMFTAAIGSQPKQSARLAKVRDARTTSERLVRELRQAKEVVSATSNQLWILTWVPNATCGASAGAASECWFTVRYDCTAGTCNRVEADSQGNNPGPARQVVSGLSNAIVFTYSPSPSAPRWVGITLQFPAEGGDDAITVEDGAALRNSTLGS